jgi:hypothetical protein
MKKLLLATTIAILTPVAAQAAPPVYYAPNSTAFANTFGPFVAHGQTSQVSVRIQNGAIDPGSTYDTTGGSTQTSSHSADGYTNSAGVVGNTGNTSATIANLHDGTVRASVSNGNGPILRSFAQGVISDTLYFNNTTGGTVFMPYSFVYDGGMSGPNLTSFSGATALLNTYGYGGCNADFTGCTGLQLTGGGSPNAGLSIAYSGDGGTSITYYGDPNLPSSYSVVRNSSGLDFSSIVSAVLEIPVGYTLFSFQLSESLDCSGAFTVCDFGHTSQFGFPSLPAGLAYSSASGAFQIAGPASPGGVPEPATWAIMIMGLGLTGTALRRRRAALA